MRQKDFEACDCKRCYFCRNGHTGQITNGMKKDYVVQYQCGKHLHRRGCTPHQVRVRDGGSYCRMCYKTKT
jgi:hypothetical protein